MGRLRGTRGRYWAMSILGGIGLGACGGAATAEPQSPTAPPVVEVPPTTGAEATPKPVDTPEQRCQAREVGQCRVHAEQLIAGARQRGDAAGLRRAYRAMERACELRQLTDELLDHRDPLTTPKPPDELGSAAALPEAREFGVLGLVRKGPSEVPPAPAELIDYLKERRSSYAGCIRRFVHVAEARAAAGPLPTPAGRVRTGAVSASGEHLSSEDVLRAALKIESAVLGCYAAGLRRNPEAAGRVTLRMSFVDGTGEPFRVDNGGSDLPDPEVVECVILLGYSIRLPEGSKGTAVVPFMFAPR
jgi:hypothetical protein